MGIGKGDAHTSWGDALAAGAAASGAAAKSGAAAVGAAVKAGVLACSAVLKKIVFLATTLLATGRWVLCILSFLLTAIAYGVSSLLGLPIDVLSMSQQSSDNHSAPLDGKRLLEGE